MKITEEEINDILKKTSDDALYDFSGLWEKSQMITYDYLNSFPADIWAYLGEGIKYLRTQSIIKNQLLFFNIWDPYKKMEVHGHDCLEEIVITQGSLIYLGHEYKAGEKIVLPATLMHRFSSGNFGAAFTVVFTKITSVENVF